MVTLDVESTISYFSVHYVGVTALFTGLTIETMPSLHILHMYIKHDRVNCLQWCYMASTQGI